MAQARAAVALLTAVGGCASTPGAATDAGLDRSPPDSALADADVAARDLAGDEDRDLAGDEGRDLTGDEGRDLGGGGESDLTSGVDALADLAAIADFARADDLSPLADLRPAVGDANVDVGIVFHDFGIDSGSPATLFCGCLTPFCNPRDAGGRYCSPSSQYCCDDNGSFSCQSFGASCAGTAITCAGTSDCPSGQVCCAIPGGSFVSLTECKAACGSDSTDPNGFRLCTRDADCADLAMPCKISTGLSPLHRCRY